MVVNIQNVVFFIVTACNFVAGTDASKENAASAIVILNMVAHLFSIFSSKLTAFCIYINWVIIIEVEIKVRIKKTKN
jgi:hypothetical protein